MSIAHDSATGTVRVHVGTEGRDTIRGSTGDDWIFGDDGHDILIGGPGNDSISGGLGNDRIVGGLGENDVTGGFGADRFVATPGGTQHVLDFEFWEGDRVYIGGDYVDSKTGLVDMDRLKVENFGYDLILLGERDGRHEVLATLNKAAGLSLEEILAPKLFGDVAGDASTSATLEPGSPVTDTFEYGSDRDWFRFEATAGTTYAFTIRPDKTSDDPASSPSLTLYDARSDPLSNVKYDYSGAGMKAFYEAEEDQLIYVAAEEFFSEPGEYVLSAEVDEIVLDSAEARASATIPELDLV